MKKIILLILVFTFVLSASSKVSALNVAPLFKIEVTPDNSGKDAQYRIYGSICEYSNVKALKLYFRADTGFHFSWVSSGTVLVNGISAIGASFKKLPDGTVEVTINLSRYLNEGDPLEILFKEEAGLINPITPATCYFMRIVFVDSKGVELGTASSERYRIGLSAVSNSSVTIEPQVRGVNAEYSVFFITGVKGSLKANLEEIRIKFPPGTIFPSLLVSSKVLINGKLSSTIYRDSEDPYVMRVFSSFDIPARTPVGVLFKKEFGIKNTLTPGTYKIFVSTYTEPDWDESDPFVIVEPQVKDLLIKISKDTILAYTSMIINFKTSQIGFLEKSNKIYVSFPVEFEVPLTFPDSAITVNGTNAYAEALSNTVIITSPISILNNDDVEIVINEEAKIKNPLKTGEYTINLHTDTDTSKSQFAITIKESTIQNVNAQLLYSGTGTVNSFNISFVTGPAYTLIRSVDFVKIEFPEGFEIPENIPLSAVLVDDTNPTSIIKEGNILLIFVPFDVPSNSTVTVKISEEAQVKNPVNTGIYSLKVSTSKEITSVESSPINIVPLPVVELTINPAVPDGSNGIYRKSPTIVLSTSNGKEVYYKLDDKNFVLFIEQFSIPEGEHTVYAYAVDSNGNKGDVINRIFTVDNTPPKVLFDGGIGDIYTNNTNAIVNGKVSEPCVLQVAGIIVDVKNGLTFSVSLNVYDGMPVPIFMRDLAGNSISILITAHVDSTPPVIELVNPKSENFDTAEQSIILEFKVNKQGTVTVNSNMIESINGTYLFTADLVDGENGFAIVARDLAGNEATENITIKRVNEVVIKLVIGNTTAYIGSSTSTLDAPPFIEKGFTLVPLRFISEAFGASVDWNDALKVITINYRTLTIQLQVGSNVVLVGTEFKKLDVPPKIVNGRTFVPIRFISETFGAEVGWDGATKTVTIVYKL